MEIHPLAWMEEGFRMLTHASRVHTTGYRRFLGSPEEIAARIVHDCWNGTFFQTSLGHFKSFYVRDFGISAKALLEQGYRKEVLLTLQHAIEAFEGAGRVATTITPRGNVFDVFSYGPDSLAFLLHALVLTKDRDLVSFHKEFLEKEARFCYDTAWDADKSHVKENEYFTSMKDNARRNSSVYDNCMIGMASRCLDTLGLDNPWKGFDFGKMVVDAFWTGAFFRDDLSKEEIIAGDANTIPFWTGIITDKDILSRAMTAIEKADLAYPFPLRYMTQRPRGMLFPAKILAPNYEGTTIWAHLGMLFIEVLAAHDPEKAKRHLTYYRQNIEQHGTFLELYGPGGKPYRSPLYVADEGMLWAANYLSLAQKLAL